MRVRCIKNRSGGVRHRLSLRAPYEVIGIEAGWFRIIDDDGMPVLFDPALFKVVDQTRPIHWVSRVRDGAEYAYAPQIGKPGFFEDIHEGDPQARRIFHRYVNEHLRLTEAA